MNLPEIEWVTRRALFLLPLLVLIVAWAFYSGRGRRPLSAFPRIVRRWFTESGLSDKAPRMRRVGRGLLFGLGIVLAGLALARPQWGKIQEQSFEQQREILVALDLSQSMLAEDVPPSRLARSKLLIEGLLDALRGERVGLALFAGTAFLQSPLSADHEVMRDLLPDLDPSYIPQGGTDYAALLKTALGAFGQGDADRFLVILSDGEAHDEAWKALIPELAKRGIHVIGLGVGTSEGAVVPNARGGYLKDERGAVVLSRLTPSTLQVLARQTGGLYEDAAAWVDIADVIERTVARGAKGAFAEQKAPRLRERFQVFLGPGLLCLLLSYWLEFPVPPHARKLGGQDRTIKPGEFFQTSSLVLPFLALASVLALAGIVRAAPPAVPQANAVKPPAGVAQSAGGAAEPAAEEQPELVKIIGALSEKPEVRAQDYASMAEETLRFASEPTSASRETRSSVVDDALAAVDRGEALDPGAAHWKELREKLEALRDQLAQPPPRPPQSSQSKQNQQGESGQGAESKGASEQGAKGDSSQAEQGEQAHNAPAQSGQASQGENSDSSAAQPPETAGSSAQQKGEEESSSPSDAAPGKSGGAQPETEPKALHSDNAGLGGLASKDQDEQTAERGAALNESKPPEFKEGSRVVGGGDGRDQQLQAEHPELSDALSRMEGVVDGDSPATLYQRMQKEPGSSASKQSEGKNW